MNERIMEIVKLLKKQEELQYDDSISDDMYYILDEKISNEIANNYLLEEIEKAQEIFEKENK